MLFTAIRTCYSPTDIETTATVDFDKYESKRIGTSEVQSDGKLKIEYITDSERLMRQIASSGHCSVLEHISFTFGIDGISRACLAQLTRHRIASYSVQSQRYVKQNTDSKHGKAQFVLPEMAYLEEERKKDAVELLDQTTKILQEAYDKLIALGAKAEDARAILPQSSECNLVMSINLRSFMNFYKLRNKNTHAQAEIANLAEEMKYAIIKVMPWTEWFFNNIK